MRTRIVVELTIVLLVVLMVVGMAEGFMRSHKGGKSRETAESRLEAMANARDSGGRMGRKDAFSGHGRVDHKAERARRTLQVAEEKCSERCALMGPGEMLTQCKEQCARIRSRRLEKVLETEVDEDANPARKMYKQMRDFGTA